MLKVGITGGIGSGKSVVAKVFASMGIPVYNADEQAKWLMNHDAGLRSKIVAAFGEESYNSEGLNRSYLATHVFHDEAQLRLLNSIVHPAVIAHGKEWMMVQQTPYALKEAALFFESGSAADLDFIIGVYAPQPLRLLRAMRRDGLGRDAVLARMQKQIDEDIKMRLCDAVITNDDQQMVIPQVLQLHDRLLQLADSKK